MKGGQCGDCQSMPHYTHTLTLQEPIAVTDAMELNDDANWTNVMTIRGRFRTRGASQGSLGNKERQVFNQTVSTVTSILLSPWTPKLDGMLQLLPTYRLKMRDRKFNIHAAYRPDELGRELLFELEERRQVP